MRLLVGLGLVALAGAIVIADPAGEARAAAPSGQAAGSPSTADDHAVMGKLQHLFGTSGALPNISGPDEKSRAEAYRRFVREQMAQNAFYRTVLPRLYQVFRSPPPLIWTALRQAKVQGQDVYFSGKGPCTLASSTLVAPWWAPKTKVRICNEDYRPEVRRDDKAAVPHYCDAQDVEPRPMDGPDARGPCRCGAYLLNCAPQREYEGVRDAAEEETARTFQHVVQQRLPLSNILTMNETVRSEMGEFFYARSRYFETGQWELTFAHADEPARLKARRPEYSGGILTTPQVRYLDSRQRTVTNMLWTDFLCVPLVGTRVDAHTMLRMTDGPAMKTNAFNFKDQMPLTVQVGCKDCHVRMEYGMRPFTEFADMRIGVRYERQDSPPQDTRFYVRDATDLRAEGPATPAWFGKTMAAQPEFVTCQVNRVEQFINNGAPVSSELDAKLTRQFRATQSFADLMEDAVVGRFVGHGTARGAELSPSKP